MKKTNWSLIFVLILLAGSVAALVGFYPKNKQIHQDDMLKGQIALDAGDFNTAFATFKPLAEQGNAKAQMYLGRMYTDGEGVEINYNEAKKWYQASAEQGDTSAQVNLGGIYETGKGVLTDKIEAYKWYLIAASRGDLTAQAVFVPKTEKTLSEPEKLEGKRRADEWISEKNIKN